MLKLAWCAKRETTPHFHKAIGHEDDGETMSDDNWSTSTGHAMADENRLDKHYLAAKIEYEETIHAAGIQANWHVLDAGCGNGVFLPYIADLVGPEGKISVIDVAPENIDAINNRVKMNSFQCQIEARTGNIIALPYETNSFDAVWCANVTQYLDEDELKQTLSEFLRVVRPNGLVAIKEVDISFWQYQPLDPGLVFRLFESVKNRADNVQIRGALRGTRIPAWVRSAGFEILKRQTFLVERWAPLTPIEHEFIVDNLSFMAGIAAESDLSMEDKEVWERLAESPDYVLDDPDFCYRDIHVLTVGISS